MKRAWLLASLLVACDPPALTSDASVIDDAGTADAASEEDADTPDAGPSYGRPEVVGTLPTSGLPEVSGIVASRTQPGILWVENDSGNTADVFAIDTTGALRATIHVDGSTNVDWEDIAIGNRDGVDELIVADVGNNVARETDGASGRTTVVLWRFPEPDASSGDQSVTAERIELAYPDRPYDCEAVFVDHRSGDVVLVTKEATPAEIFVARAPLDLAAPNVLQHVGTIDLTLATAADMSTDASRIVVRGYSMVRVFSLDATTDVAAALSSPYLSALSGSAAEAIAFEHAGYGLYTVAEGNGASLYYLPFE